MQIELGFLSRFMLKLKHRDINNEKEKITQVFERAINLLEIYLYYIGIIYLHNIKR